MKKLLILTSLFTLLLTTIVNAQNLTDQATLRVNLYPVQAISVNIAQSLVELDYNTYDHYQDGVITTMQDHLTVFSTGGFNVNVKSSTPELQSGTSTLGGIKLTATPGSTATTSQASLVEVNLSDTDQILLSGTIGEVSTKYTVAYEGLGDGLYSNKGQENGLISYETLVLYTISPN